MAGSRREFLRRAGSFITGTVAAPWTGRLLGASGEPARSGAAGLPPHRAVALEGVHAYPGSRSVRAGETLSLHASADRSYRLTVLRPVTGIDRPEDAERVLDLGEAPARTQPIHPGSYVHVERGLSPDARLRALTLECWLRPWRTDDWMGVLTQCDVPRGGLGLFLGPGGRVALLAGGGRPEDGHLAPEGTVAPERWHHLAGTVEDGHCRLFVDGRPAGRWPARAGGVVPAPAPIRIGAAGVRGKAGLFLDGDVAQPVLRARALRPDEVARRSEENGLRRAEGEDLLAAWPLDEERGMRVADAGPGSRHGRIVNGGTWMVGGPSYDGAAPRFGEYDPGADPRRGHGLRLASDDLADCRWEATHRIEVPPDARPGIWAAALEFELEGERALYPVSFVVRRPAAAPRAPVLVLCASNTWHAYSGTPFARNVHEVLRVFGTHGAEELPSHPPAHCLYRPHRAGQGTYWLATRMPWPAASPWALYGRRTRYGHLARAELWTHAWLEREGLDFDVASDLDLHREPDLLDGRRALVVNGHSEYWSAAMYGAVERYLAGGGGVLSLSGNTMFWRVSFDEDAGIMECRKVDCPGQQMPPGRRGECWHAHDGERGGLMRECGYPAWRLLGLETLGWIDQNDPSQFGPWIVERAGHPLFRSPERIEVEEGEALGTGPEGRPSNNGGHEVDVRLSTLEAVRTRPVPDGAPVPEDPEGIELLAAGRNWGERAVILDAFGRPGSSETARGAEVIWWERPDGGRVLHLGAIGAGWALYHDGRAAALARNALARFGVRTRRS